MATVKITAVPQRQSSAVFGFQQPGTEKGERSPSRTGRHQKCLYLTCGLLDKLPFYQPTSSDKAAFRNTDAKMRSWVVIYGSSSGLYIYYNYTQP